MHAPARAGTVTTGRARGGAFRGRVGRRKLASVPRCSPLERQPMLSGSFLHDFLKTGLIAVVFILLLKTFVAPHLPAGGQKAVAAI